MDVVDSQSAISSLPVIEKIFNFAAQQLARKKTDPGGAIEVPTANRVIGVTDTIFAGDQAAIALAEKLKVKTEITSIDLGNRSVGTEGAVAIAEALKVNRTVTYVELSGNAIGDEGAVALAEALTLNTTVTTIRLSTCNIGDLGLLCLYIAMKSNASVTKLNLDRNEVTLDATDEALSELLSRVSYTSPQTELNDSLSLAFKKWMSGRKGVDWFAIKFLQLCNAVGNLHKYSAVAAVLANNAPLALELMRLYPCNLGRVIDAAQESSFFPWRSSGVIAELLALKDPPIDSSAARAASAVAAAVQGRGALSVVNVHICGEGYAGKTTTREAIVSSISSAIPLILQSTIPDIPLADGRTLGMVSSMMDYKDRNGQPVRALLHDYGGQVEFRANHAEYLAAPNSVYLFVLPLWDMRPCPSPNQDKPLNKPMELDELVATYTDWLKFINTVVENRGYLCVTALNFSAQFQAKRRSYTLQEAISALVAVQERLCASKLRKLSFVGKPVALDSNSPTSVSAQLVPVLKLVLDSLGATPVPVAPALQSVLADMAVPNKWPLFSYETTLKGLIREAVAASHTPTCSKVPEERVRDDVVQTIAHIIQTRLESRQDVLVFPVHGGERLSINRPNWLTEELLGNLFDPRRRARVNEAAALVATSEAVYPTHLLSGQVINEAARANLCAATNAMLDVHFIPKLLQHVGVCIPVQLGADGLARGVAEGDDLSRVTHWFPAFSTTPMKETDGTPLKDCDHIVARQFKLVNPDFCVFPPGYFSSLFVGIAGLYDQAHLVQLYQDGMELCSGSETLQVVVRRCADALSFVVTLVTRGTPAGSSLAFDTMQAITQLIFGPGSWRRNVQVLECGLHPTKLLKAAAIPVETLLSRLKDPAWQEISMSFYFGMERQGADRMVALKLEAVLAKLDAADRKADDHHALVMTRLNNICAQVEAQHDMMERVEDALAEASAALTDSSEQLRGMCDQLLEALHSPGRSCELDMTEESAQKAAAAARGFLQKHRDMLVRAASLTAAQLQQVKCEIVEELGKVAADMQRSTLAKLQEREDAQSAAAEERLQSLLIGQYQSTGDALRELHSELTAQIAELKAQQADATAGAGSAQMVGDSVLRLQESIAAVQTAQRNDRYGVYELPLLAEIKSQAPRGTVKDAALRCMYEVYRLHFLCPVCGVPAASGPEQKGYKLLVTKGWVAKVSKVLEVSLLALQVVSLVTPLPLPRVAELADYLPTKELRAVADALDFGAEKVNSLVNASEDGVKGVQDATPQPPEITLEHVASIRELLLLAKESSPPKHTDLSPAICAATQQCAWVCAGACRDKYMAQGDACLAIKIKLA